MDWKTLLTIISIGVASALLPFGCGEQRVVNVPIGDGSVDDGRTDPVPIPPAPPSNEPGFVSFAWVEDAILRDLAGLTNVQRAFTRYVLCTDQYNEGLSVQEVDSCRKAIQKGINSLSNKRGIVTAASVDDEATILRIDVRDLGWTRDTWCLIENADPFAFESFTTRGLLIKQLTQTRQPWMHANNFSRISQNGNTYYDIIGVPQTLSEFFAKLGSNVARDIQNEDEGLIFAGFQGSPIAIGKNRQIIRFDTAEGYAWMTFDFNPNFNERKDIFAFPFPALFFRGNRTFIHDAQEYIFPLRNGFHGYALYNGQQIREVAAPADIVTDTQNGGLDPAIKNSQKCFKCHAQGILPATDQALDRINNNPLLGADEKVLARQLFKSQQALNDYINQDNNPYQAALLKIGIGPRDGDPLNTLVDKLDREMTAKQVAAMFFMKEADFIAKLRGSGVASNEAGELINGGTISPVKFPQSAKVIVKELNIFTDDEL